MNPVEIRRGDSFKRLSEYLLKGKSDSPSVQEILEVITRHQAVFTRQDLARHLNRTVDETVDMAHTIERVLASEDVVVLRSAEDPESVYFSTWEMVSIEQNMMASVDRLAADCTHGVASVHVDEALSKANAALWQVANVDLSEEQQRAVRHVTGQARLAIVSGLAGAGKSTMLAAAKDAWEAQGYTVYGAALAGKAAEGLQASSGIASRTLASFEMGWQNGYRPLSKSDVFVIDEAGMVGSRQLARFVSAVEQAGAKLVLVGDSEQLQAIAAGAPFRHSVEAHGSQALENVVRQRDEWQREATYLLAKSQTGAALQAYEAHGGIDWQADGQSSVSALVDDYLSDLQQHSAASRLALAHRRVDVQAINLQIREALKARGDLGQGVVFESATGSREFAVGDRLLFTENNRELEVKNGMLGTVVGIDNGELQVRLDGDTERDVSVSSDQYDAVDYGYATTIHKSQGMSVDRSFVLASRTLDRHLTYVALSRHKASTKVYADEEQFASMSALSRRLGREGLKRSTLDFSIDHAQSMRHDLPIEPAPSRVGWTQTYNLGSCKDTQAHRMMTATVDSAEVLKEAHAQVQGVPYKKGKKTTKPVYHYSITWPEVDAPSDELQRLAVKESLQALGLDEYQALAVQHLDGKPHVHVCLNLVHPETGMNAATAVKQANGKKASKLTRSHKKLRAWANRFEQLHQLQITVGSHENAAKRKTGKAVDARRKSRVVHEREQDQTSEWLQDFQSARARTIGDEGRAMEAQYQARFTQLNSEFQAKMQSLQQQKAEDLARYQRDFSARFKPQWTALARTHHERLRAFELQEQSSVGSLINAVGAFFHVKSERDSVLQGLYAATSKQERRELVERWNRQERRKLSAREKAEREAFLDCKVCRPIAQTIDDAQAAYLAEDQRLRDGYKADKKALRKKWRDYSAQQIEQGVCVDRTIAHDVKLSTGLRMSLD